MESLVYGILGCVESSGIPAQKSPSTRAYLTFTISCRGRLQRRYLSKSRDAGPVNFIGSFDSKRRGFVFV
jgi:hypothetical protein